MGPGEVAPGVCDQSGSRLLWGLSFCFVSWGLGTARYQSSSADNDPFRFLIKHYPLPRVKLNNMFWLSIFSLQKSLFLVNSHLNIKLFSLWLQEYSLPHWQKPLLVFSLFRLHVPYCPGTLLGRRGLPTPCPGAQLLPANPSPWDTCWTPFLREGQPILVLYVWRILWGSYEKLHFKIASMNKSWGHALSVSQHGLCVWLLAWWGWRLRGLLDETKIWIIF